MICSAPSPATQRSRSVPSVAAPWIVPATTTGSDAPSTREAYSVRDGSRFVSKEVVAKDVAIMPGSTSFTRTPIAESWKDGASLIPSTANFEP